MQKNLRLRLHGSLDQHLPRVETRVDSDRCAAARVHGRKRSALAGDTEFANAIVGSRSQNAGQPIVSGTSLNGERALADCGNEALDFKRYEMRCAHAQPI